MDRKFLEENLKNKSDWIKHANQIAAILFAFNGVFISWIASKFYDFHDLILFNKSEIILIWFFGLSSLIIFAILLWVVIPRLGRKNSSLWYFNGIAIQSKKEFLSKIRSLDNAEIEEIYMDQIYQLAKIARNKFRLIRWLIFIMIINILSSILFIVFVTARI